MFNSIDMRVLLIGAVALVVAVYEGPGTSGSGVNTPPVARPTLVRCAPTVVEAGAFAAIGPSDPIVTGSVGSDRATPTAAACR